MIALGLACGWIWQRLRRARASGIALLLFAIAVALLFALDFFILLQNAPEVARSSEGAADQVGPIAPDRAPDRSFCVPSLLIGYGARRLWSALPGREYFRGSQRPENGDRAWPCAPDRV